MSTIDNPERVQDYFRRRADQDARKKEIAEEAKEMKAEFKAENFDMAALEAAYKLSLIDEGELEEKDFVVQAYLKAGKK